MEMINGASKTASRIMADLIEKSEGKFVTVEFIKKDGTPRKLTGRLGVTKDLAGGVRTTDPSKYIIIHENGGGYRNINKDTITSLRLAGLSVQAS